MLVSRSRLCFDVPEQIGERPVENAARRCVGRGGMADGVRRKFFTVCVHFDSQTSANASHHTTDGVCRPCFAHAVEKDISAPMNVRIHPSHNRSPQQFRN